jgi:hypothetical protein
VGGIVKQKVDVFGFEMLNSYDRAAMSSVLEIKRWSVTNPAGWSGGRGVGALEIIVNISDQ